VLFDIAEGFKPRFKSLLNEFLLGEVFLAGELTFQRCPLQRTGKLRAETDCDWN